MYTWSCIGIQGKKKSIRDHNYFGMSVRTSRVAAAAAAAVTSVKMNSHCTTQWEIQRARSGLWGRSVAGSVFPPVYKLARVAFSSAARAPSVRVLYSSTRAPPRPGAAAAAGRHHSRFSLTRGAPRRVPCDEDDGGGDEEATAVVTNFSESSLSSSSCVCALLLCSRL